MKRISYKENSKLREQSSITPGFRAKTTEYSVESTDNEIYIVRANGVVISIVPDDPQAFEATINDGADITEVFRHITISASIISIIPKSK